MMRNVYNNYIVVGLLCIDMDYADVLHRIIPIQMLKFLFIPEGVNK